MKLSRYSVNDYKLIDNIDDNFINKNIEKLGVKNIWNKTKGEGVKIAIIDSGINHSHPDLYNKINKIINFKHYEESIDLNGHGTAMAGVIAGDKTGVAPNSELYIAKVLNKDGFGTASDILEGITFAINYNVDILSVSLGMRKEVPKGIKLAIDKATKKGITVVCATGNLGRRYVDYPARYSNVIGVGGLDEDGNLSQFSNYGDGMNFTAPSTNVITTNNNGKYISLNGTSLSSAYVAGVVALVKSYYRKYKNKELNNNELINIMERMFMNDSEYDFDFNKLEEC